MTFAELLLALFFIAILYRILMPFRQMMENIFLRLLGARGLHVIDVSVIKEKKPKE
jgi:hypothetical protein